MSAKKKLRLPGAEPVAAPAVRGWSIILSLLLLALAGAAGRELWVWYKHPAGQSLWTDKVQTTPLPSMTIAGIIAGVVTLFGLLLVIAAFKPRAKHHRNIPVEGASVWMRPVDIARFSTANAKKLPGVRNASTLANRKRAIVTAIVDAGDPSLDENAEKRMEEILKGLVGPEYQVKVNIRHNELFQAPREDSPDIDTEHHNPLSKNKVIEKEDVR